MVVVGRQAPAGWLWVSTILLFCPLAGLNDPVNPAAVHAARAFGTVEPTSWGTTAQTGVVVGLGVGVGVGFGAGFGAGVGLRVGAGVGAAVGAGVAPGVGGRVGCGTDVGFLVATGRGVDAAGPRVGPLPCPVPVVSTGVGVAAVGPSDGGLEALRRPVGPATVVGSEAELEGTSDAPSTPPAGRNRPPTFVAIRATATTRAPATTAGRGSNRRSDSAARRCFFSTSSAAAAAAAV